MSVQSLDYVVKKVVLVFGCSYFEDIVSCFTSKFPFSQIPFPFCLLDDGLIVCACVWSSPPPVSPVPHRLSFYVYFSLCSSPLCQIATSCVSFTPRVWDKKNSFLYFVFCLFLLKIKALFVLHSLCPVSHLHLGPAILLIRDNASGRVCQYVCIWTITLNHWQWNKGMQQL